MEKVILVVHGSPRKEANRWEYFLGVLAHKLGRPLDLLSIAYLQFGSPSLEEALEEAVKRGFTKIFVHPFFLSAGNHVKEDIPEILNRFQQDNPNLEIIYTAPLGFHEKLADIVRDRLEEVGFLKAQEIERRSMEIINKEFDLSKFSPLERKIIERVLHATADPEYLETMVFHPQAIEMAINSLRGGRDILVDVEMVKAGVIKRFNRNKVLCYLSHVDEEGEGTRTERAIEMALSEETNIGLVAIGNAPTALLKAIEILKTQGRQDIVVIGMPVGFVRALEAKLLLSTQDFPFITNLSRKGGSPATVAVVNALLKLAHEQEEWSKNFT